MGSHREELNPLAPRVRPIQDWAPWYTEFDALLKEVSDPSACMLDARDRFIDGWASVFDRAPNAWAIRRAFLVEPELRVLDQGDDDGMGGVPYPACGRPRNPFRLRAEFPSVALV